MAVTIKVIPAMFFYFLYLAGLIVFAVSPVLPPQNGVLVAGLALVLGIMGYVSLTNTPTLKDYSITLTWMDIAWGIFVSIISAVLGIYTARILSGN